jgi:hypothetical protein
MSWMFNSMHALTTIYASNKLTTDNVLTSDVMFDNCANIIGGKGTTFDASHVDKKYAHIDADGDPGYFTLKD